MSDRTMGASPPISLRLQAFVTAVVLFAGVTGVALFVFVRSTHRFFSWALGPPPLSALIGGLYLASAVSFGLALLQGSWEALRGLCVASLALAVPTLAVSIIDHETFDFGRWQAWGWFALFGAATVTLATSLHAPLLDRGPQMAALRPGARVLVAALAAGYAGLAIALWAGADPLPFPLPDFGRHFLGCWMTFLSVLGVWTAARNDWDEASSALVALVAHPAAALVSGVRSITGMAPVSGRVSYLGALTGLTLLSFGLLVMGRQTPLAPLVDVDAGDSP